MTTSRARPRLFLKSGQNTGHHRIMTLLSYSPPESTDTPSRPWVLCCRRFLKMFEQQCDQLDKLKASIPEADAMDQGSCVCTCELPPPPGMVDQVSNRNKALSVVLRVKFL